jgi:hypothetical protein
VRRIPTLFVRDPEDRRFVTDQVTPGSEWVLAGEGVATRQYNGVCVSYDPSLVPETDPALTAHGTNILDGWWARRWIRSGEQPPPGFVPLEADPESGRTVGWEPATQSPHVHSLLQAVMSTQDPQPGTYELIGPRIKRNPERADRHTLVRHEDAPTVDAPRTYEALRQWLPRQGYEGVVWHHPDGRYAKLKRGDLRLTLGGRPAALPATAR